MSVALDDIDEDADIATLAGMFLIALLPSAIISLATFLEAAKSALQDTLLLQTPKESFDESILFGRIRCDELLGQSIVSTRLSEASTLNDQPVITP